MRLLNQYRGKFCYTQGTRITIIVHKPITELGSVAKMGSTVTAVFNQLCPNTFTVFDATIEKLSNLEDGLRKLRDMKASVIRKTVSMICEQYYSVNEVKKRTTAQRLEMIKEKDDNWENYDEAFRIGIVLVRDYNVETKKYKIHNKQNLI